MKARTSNILWGLVLILGGGLFLAENLGYLDGLGALTWAGIFAAASLFFLAAYAINGLKQWGWLFPASISGGVALTIYMAETTSADAAVGAPVLISIGLPFAVAFALDPRRRWWALIPAWVMAVLTLVILVADRVSGELIGSLFMFSIALPFLVVYLANRIYRWALIPAFVLTAVGIIPLLATQVSGEAFGAYACLMIALPFLAVFLWSRQNWWALIPAGIMGTAAVNLLIFLPGPGEIVRPDWLTAGMFLGWALTFGALWLLRRDQPTAWAAYPAIGLGLGGIMAFFLGTRFDLFWPLAIIAVGIVVLLGSLGGRTAQ